MYACMTPVGFDTSDKFENHCFRVFILKVFLNLKNEACVYSTGNLVHISKALCSVFFSFIQCENKCEKNLFYSFDVYNDDE